MLTATRIDEETGKQLVWCGGENFNPIEMQASLQTSGLTLKEIRDDKWAVVESVAKEIEDGREE